MGWLFGWRTRKDLVDHLLHGKEVKTIKHICVGNNLWTVQEGKNQEGETITIAVLYKLQGPPPNQKKEDRNAWGYKDIDETMGPYHIDFPASWLSLLSPINNPYALEWRKAVKARGEKIDQMRLGTFWKMGERTYKIVKRRGPSAFIVVEADGQHWRTTVTVLLKAEKVEGFECASGKSTTDAGSAQDASVSAATAQASA